MSAEEPWLKGDHDQVTDTLARFDFGLRRNAEHAVDSMAGCIGICRGQGVGLQTTAPVFE